MGSDGADAKVHLMEPLVHRQIGGPGAAPTPSLARKPGIQSEEPFLGYIGGKRQKGIQTVVFPGKREPT